VFITYLDFCVRCKRRTLMLTDENEKGVVPMCMRCTLELLSGDYCPEPGPWNLVSNYDGEVDVVAARSVNVIAGRNGGQVRINS